MPNHGALELQFRQNHRMFEISYRRMVGRRSLNTVRAADVCALILPNRWMYALNNFKSVGRLDLNTAEWLNVWAHILSKQWAIEL